MLPDRKFSYSSGGDIQIFWLIWTSLLDLLDIVCVGAQTPVKPVINSSLVKKFNMNKITAKIPLLKIFLPRWQKYEVSKDVSVGYAVRTLERRKLEFAITKVWEWCFCISVLGLPESQKKSNQAAKQWWEECSMWNSAALSHPCPGESWDLQGQKARDILHSTPSYYTSLKPIFSDKANKIAT